MVRRKSVSGHTVIAEATKATGAIMAAQMQEIADASRDLERSKIDVQLKLFTEQMSYQREKDRRMYENAAIANENARLSILKQGEMVSCLSQLSHVLSTGLQMSSTFSQAVTAPGGNDRVGTGAAHHHHGGQPVSHAYGMPAYTSMAWAPSVPLGASTSTAVAFTTEHMAGAHNHATETGSPEDELAANEGEAGAPSSTTATPV